MKTAANPNLNRSNLPIFPIRPDECDIVQVCHGHKSPGNNKFGGVGERRFTRAVEPRSYGGRTSTIIQPNIPNYLPATKQIRICDSTVIFEDGGIPWIQRTARFEDIDFEVTLSRPSRPSGRCPIPNSSNPLVHPRMPFGQFVTVIAQYSNDFL